MLLFLAVLVGLTGAAPIYRKVQEERARRLVPQARAAFEAGNLEEARIQIRAMLRLSSRQTDVVRLTAQFCARTGNVDGIHYWNLLLSGSDGTREDRLALVEMALGLNRLELILPNLQRILEMKRTDRSALRLLVHYYQRIGATAESVSAARTWLKEHPLDSEAEYVLGSVLLESSIVPEQTEGARLLWGQTIVGGRWTELAASTLAFKSDLSRLELIRLLEVLEEKPETWLAAARIRLRLQPKDRDAILDTVCNSLEATTPEDDRVAVAQWLAEEGELERALLSVPMDKVVAHSALIPVRIRILLEQKNIEDVQALLGWGSTSSNTFILFPYVEACVGAMKLHHAGQGVEALGKLQDALSLSARDVNALAMVAGYAAYLGDDQTALTASLRQLDLVPRALKFVREVLRLAEKLKDDSATHLAIKRWSELHPDDDQMAVREAYQASLLNLTPRRARDFLLSYHRKFPRDFLGLATLALVDLRERRPVEALALFDSLTLDLGTMDPRYQAVYVAVMHENQLDEAVRKLAIWIPLDRLTPAEQRLLPKFR